MPSKYVRKTEDEWRLMGCYSYHTGWEEVVAETTFKAIRDQAKVYRANEPKTRFKITGPHRVKLAELA